MNYESMLNKTAKEVINTYGRELSRKQINQYMIELFPSKDYTRTQIRKDALTCFSCALKGKWWYAMYKVRTHAENIVFGAEKQKAKQLAALPKEESLIEFLRNETDRTGRHGRYKKGAHA